MRGSATARPRRPSGTSWGRSPSRSSSRGPEATDTPDRRGALLALALLLGLIAVGTGNTTLLLWCVGIASIAGGIGAWTRVAWKKVSVTSRFQPSRAFSGETVNLIVRISNGKRLPLPHVRARIWLPSGLRPADGTSEMTHTIRGFQRDFSMPGRRELVLDLPVKVRRRGEYWLEQ